MYGRCCGFSKVQNWSLTWAVPACVGAAVVGCAPSGGPLAAVGAGAAAGGSVPPPQAARSVHPTTPTPTTVMRRNATRRVSLASSSDDCCIVPTSPLNLHAYWHLTTASLARNHCTSP